MEKKTAKREYKEMKHQAGVFKITNKVNGKIFIKASPNIPAAFNSIRFQISLGSGFFDASLNREWKEYGEENFEFTVLEELKPSENELYDKNEELKKLEKKWLEKLKPYGEKGYNRKKAV